MRCHDDILWQLLHPRPVAGKNIERIGINDERTGSTAQLGDEGDGCCLVLSQSGTYAQRIEHLCIYRFAEYGFFSIHLQYRFRYRNLHDFIIPLWGMGCYLARTGSQTSLGG